MTLNAFIIYLLATLFATTQLIHARTEPQRPPDGNAADWSLVMPVLDSVPADRACTGYDQRNRCQVICLEQLSNARICMRDRMPQGTSQEDHVKAILEKITKTETALRQLGRFHLPDSGTDFNLFATRIISEAQKKCNAPGATCTPVTPTTREDRIRRGTEQAPDVEQ